jgi:hypothetical protein
MPFAVRLGQCLSRVKLRQSLKRPYVSFPDQSAGRLAYPLARYSHGVCAEEKLDRQQKCSSMSLKC